MKKLLILAVCLFASTANALLGDCALKFAGGVVLEDKHHVGYILEVENPTNKPLSFYVRLDFIYKGQKIQGVLKTLKRPFLTKAKENSREASLL